MKTSFVAWAHPRHTSLSTADWNWKAARLLLIASVFLVAGCLPSVNPLYTQQDLIYDPALVGTWTEKSDANARWTFSKLDDKAYALVITEKGESSPFVAHLFKLRDQRFLDLQPDKAPLETAKFGDSYKSLLILGHLFLRLDQTEPKLILASMEGDWLNKLLKTEPAALDHARVEDDRLVLTASTKDLQAFVVKHLKDAGAWAEPTELARIARRSADNP